MKVNEIFHSIQGESSFMGWPCAFIRLTACDLRCTYCDTEYAFYEGKEMSVDEILRVVDGYPTKLALVTGGEPMLQKDVHTLFRALLERDYTVCVETGGHVLLESVDPRVHKIMDLKCPSSGMAHRNNYDNIRYLMRSSLWWATGRTSSGRAVEFWNTIFLRGCGMFFFRRFMRSFRMRTWRAGCCVRDCQCACNFSFTG